MNQKLRRRHRRMAVALAIVAPAVFALALLTRPPQPLQASLPSLGGNNPAADAVLVADDTFSLDGTPMTARLVRDSGGTHVLLAPQDGAAVVGADVLVYWFQGGNVSAVPDDARLLGTLAGPQSRAFALPDDVSGGALLFYSLAEQRLFDSRWSLPN